MSYELAFLKALILTVALECIAAAALKFFAGRRLSKSGLPLLITPKDLPFVRFFMMVALASTVTLPYVWFILPAFVPRGLFYVVVSEVAVTVAEALWYYFCLLPLVQKNAATISKINLQKEKSAVFTSSVILSASANAFSYVIGNIFL